MKIKRVIAICLCLMLFAMMSIGSGSSTSGSRKDITASGGQQATDGGSDSDQGIPETDGGSGEGSANAGDSDEAVTNITIDEQVLVDQDGIRITATGYEADSVWGEGIGLLIENNSDKDYTVGCDALIVNDYMISDLFATTVAAGKKATDTMYLSSTQLKAAGIDSVGKVEMYFHAYDDDSLDRLFSEVYSEIKTSEFDHMDTECDDSGTELYNKNGIRIIGKTVDEDSFWGMAILLFCENSSGRKISINIDDMSINGFMVTPYFSSMIYDGKKAVEDITIMSGDLESNGIESIDEAELKFRIMDADTYDTIDETDTIAFSAK
ncbi:MAG: hypothetical protein K6G42_11670 [Lachnospiraceae bacterium]|nr:hypothetical protein [Lachnospiraceae bacterium]